MTQNKLKKLRKTIMLSRVIAHIIAFSLAIFISYPLAILLKVINFVHYSIKSKKTNYEHRTGIYRKKNKAEY